MYLDAMMVKMRDSGHVQNQAIYVVLGVDLEGQKEVLGLWVAQQEGAKFWLQLLPGGAEFQAISRTNSIVNKYYVDL